MVATLVELSDVQWAWAKFDIPLSSFIYSRLAPLQKKSKGQRSNEIELCYQIARFPLK